MSQEWDGKPLEDLLSQDTAVREDGMSVWTFLEHIGSGRLLRVTSAEAFSLALNETFLELYHNVLKSVSLSAACSLFAVFIFFLFILFLCVARVTCGKRGMFAGTGRSAGSC